jgi:thiamine transporter ThiT
MWPVYSEGRICTRVLMIPTLRGVSRILPLTRRLANSSSFIVVLISFPIMVAAMIYHTVHGLVTTAIGKFVAVKAEARPASCATSLTLVVPRKRIATREPAAALGTCMWTFSSVEFRMSFQVVKASETRLAGGTLVGLFLAVRQEVALEVVVSREVGRAVRAFVPLRRRRLGAVLRVAGQTHLACGCTGVVLWGQRARKGECAIAGALAWIRSDGLVVRLVCMWRLLLLLLRLWLCLSLLLLWRARAL